MRDFINCNFITTEFTITYCTVNYTVVGAFGCTCSIYYIFLYCCACCMSSQGKLNCFPVKFSITYRAVNNVVVGAFNSTSGGSSVFLNCCCRIMCNYRNILNIVSLSCCPCSFKCSGIGCCTLNCTGCRSFNAFFYSCIFAFNVVSIICTSTCCSTILTVCRP